MKVIFIRFCLLGLILALLISCRHQKDQKAETKPQAKYVFFFIGDGMGLQHVYLTKAFLQEANNGNNSIGFAALTWDDFPVYGSNTTHSNNRLITGSAAAGTALATGHNTNIGRISKSPDGGSEYKSIAEIAKEAGMKVGIISNVSIDHATPACFYAHADTRNSYYDIGKQLAESRMDFFGGGGFKYPKGKDETRTDLYEHTGSKGYHVIREKNGKAQIRENDSLLMLVNPVLGSDGEMPYAIDRKYEGGYSLADITRTAIDYLYGEEGFFMMVEGGKIDWASHNNDPAAVIYDVLDLSNAMQEAYRFYEQHPDETLIILTADHETGGLSLGSALQSYQSDYALLGGQRMSVNRMHRLHIQGGLKTDKDIMDCFGMADDKQLAQMIKRVRTKDLSDKTNYMSAAPYDPAIHVCSRMLAINSGICFSTWDHTAAPVPVYATGAGKSYFSGFYDNTNIFSGLQKAMQLSD